MIQRIINWFDRVSGKEEMRRQILQLQARVNHLERYEPKVGLMPHPELLETSIAVRVKDDVLRENFEIVTAGITKHIIESLRMHINQ